MTEYWSRRFAQEGMIWGGEPSPTALAARDLFRKHGLTSVLVPGAGYGRHTKVFSQEFQTYGIELSRDALEIAVTWDPASQFIGGSALECSLEEPVHTRTHCRDRMEAPISTYSDL